MTRFPFGRPTRGVAAALAAGVLVAVPVAGCSAPAPTPPRTAPGTGAGGSSGTGPAGGAPAAAPTPTVAPTDLPASVAASPGATALAKLPDTRSGAQLDKPFTYRGVVLVNRNHPVSKNFAPKVGDGYQLAPEADEAMAELVEDAKKAGVSLVWRVGYRSYARQTELSKTPPSAYGTAAASYVAKPGQSEHQAGLAVDVGSKQGLGSAFPKTKEFAWMRAHAHEYGFILRYPQGKTSITGFNYEPWHYRYVGREVASAFGPGSTMTLEEYLGGS